MEAITIYIPAEFKRLCEFYKIAPESVLRGFIADLCRLESFDTAPRKDGMMSNGSDEREMAWDYFCRVGYPYFSTDVAEWRNCRLFPYHVVSDSNE